MSENNQSLWKTILMPERANRFQFLLFYVVSFAITYALAVAVPELWLVFYLTAIFFFLRYVRARVNDWEGDVKYWISTLFACFLFIIAGVLVGKGYALLTLAAMISVLTVFVATLILLFKPGTGAKGKSLIDWKYHKELRDLKKKKKEYEREEELKNLRTEIDELSRKVSK